MFAHIEYIKKPFHFSLTVQIKGSRCMASYAILDFPVILHSSGGRVGRIIIISAWDVIIVAGKQREFVPLFPHVKGEVGLL